MTEQEKEVLKAEIIEEITSKMKPQLMSENVQNVLANPRNKWFRDKDEGAYHSVMGEVFGTYTYWQVWEHIRRLTCYICGKGYVRQLRESDHADDVAEKLCQTVYELAKERQGAHDAVGACRQDIGNLKGLKCRIEL